MIFNSVRAIIVAMCLSAVTVTVAAAQGVYSTMQNAVLGKAPGQRIVFPPGSRISCRNACLAKPSCKMWQYRDPGFRYSWATNKGVCYLITYKTRIYPRPAFGAAWVGQIVGR